MSSRGPRLVACAPSARRPGVTGWTSRSRSARPVARRNCRFTTSPTLLCAPRVVLTRSPGVAPRSGCARFSPDPPPSARWSPSRLSSCSLGLPLANLRRTVPAARSGCPNLPSTAGFPGLRPPFIRWRGESSTVHAEHCARAGQKITSRSFGAASPQPVDVLLTDLGSTCGHRLRCAHRPVQSTLPHLWRTRDPSPEMSRPSSHMLDNETPPAEGLLVG